MEVQNPLGDFLRSRRERLSPDALGLATLRRRRTRGDPASASDTTRRSSGDGTRPEPGGRAAGRDASRAARFGAGPLTLAMELLSVSAGSLCLDLFP